MWRLLQALVALPRLGDTSVGSRPDAMSLYRQPQVTSRAVSEYYDKHGEAAGAAERQASAVGELTALKDQLSLENAGSDECKAVTAVLEKLKKGEALNDQDMGALRGAVQSLESRLKAGVEDKASRIEQLASGYTSESDEQQIIDILKEARDPEERRAVLEALKEKGWDHLALFKEMDSGTHEAELLRLTAEAMTPEQKAEAIQQFAEGYTSGAQEQGMAALLASATTDADREALLKACQAKGISYDRIVDELEDPQRVADFENAYRQPYCTMNDPELAAAIAATPNAERALKTYVELKKLQAEEGSERLTDDTIALLTRGVATPRTGDARGQAGVMGMDSALQAARALTEMTDSDYARTTQMLQEARTGAKDPDTEQQLLLKSIGANYKVPASFLWWTSGTDEKRNDEFFKQLGAMATGMHGMERADLIRNTTLIGVEADAASLQQRYGDSCGPTTIQMLKGEKDPLYAWQVRQEGPVQSLDYGGQTAADQKRWLEELGGGRAVPREVQNDFTTISGDIRTRVQQLTNNDPPAYGPLEAALGTRVGALMAETPSDDAKIAQIRLLDKYMSDPTFTPTDAEKADITAAIADLKAQGVDIDQAKADGVRADFQAQKDEIDRLALARRYIQDGNFTPTVDEKAKIDQALGEMRTRNGGATYPSVADADAIHAQQQIGMAGTGMALGNAIDQSGRSYATTFVGDAAMDVTSDYMDQAARDLEAGKPVPLRIGYHPDHVAGHFMLMSDVKGSSPNREYLVSDPWSGRTEWVQEADLQTGNFANGAPYNFNLGNADVTHMYFPQD